MTTSPTARRRAARACAAQPSALGSPTSAPTLIEEMRDGVPTMVARFPRSARGPEQPIYLHCLNDFPQLRAPLAKTFFLNMQQLTSPATRRAVISRWRAGILSFLSEQGEQMIEFAAIDQGLVSRFIAWLDRAEEGKPALNVATRRLYLEKLRLVHATAAKHNDRIGVLVAPIDWPPDPWRGAVKARPADERFLPRERMTEILKICAGLVEERMNRLRPLLDQLEAGRSSDPVVLAAIEVKRQFRDDPLTPTSFDPNPYVYALKGQEFRRKLRELLLPSLPDLMPFILLLVHYTRFNPSVMLSLRIDGIRRIRYAAVARVVVTSDKPRGRNPSIAHFAIDDSATNPSTMLHFLERWLAVMREKLASPYLLVAKGGSRLVEPGPAYLVEGIDLAKIVRVFLKRVGVDAFQLTDVRKGMIDLVHLLTDGDMLQVRETGGQYSADVVIQHYTSRAGGRREAVRLAAGMEERQRWISSGGKVDARRLPDTSNRSAATPGFICLDHHASPIPGQSPGQPCHAYGRCPACPLAVADVSSPRSCGYLHILLHQIETSFDVNDAMTAGAFLGIWLPIARRLRAFWLPAFPAKVRQAAKALHLPMPPEIH